MNFRVNPDFILNLFAMDWNSFILSSLVAQWLRICLPMQEAQETLVQSLGQEDSLEEEMANHSSILAWRIPMDRGAWRATVSPSGREELDMT